MFVECLMIFPCTVLCSYPYQTSYFAFIHKFHQSFDLFIFHLVLYIVQTACNRQIGKDVLDYVDNSSGKTFANLITSSPCVKVAISEGCT